LESAQKFEAVLLFVSIAAEVSSRLRTISDSVSGYKTRFFGDTGPGAVWPGPLSARIVRTYRRTHIANVEVYGFKGL
jgi:hypothetical protein